MLFIPDPDPDFLPIPDPGVKKAPDPGSGSATLVDPLHFGTDPDPGIRASNQWIRILLFSSLTWVKC